MNKAEKIKLVRLNHGGLTQATDTEILTIANSLPVGTLEKYKEKAKVKKDADPK